MSELPDDRLTEATRTDPLLLEYDYYKHLSTIALVALGAILTTAQAGQRHAATMTMIAVVSVAMAAVLAFSAMNQIIDHRKTGKPLRRFFRWERGLSTALFATGLGLFMSELGKALN